MKLNLFPLDPDLDPYGEFPDPPHGKNTNTIVSQPWCVECVCVCKFQMVCHPPPPPSLGLPCIHLILRRERERYFLTSGAQHHLDPDLVKLVVYAVLGIWTRPDQNKFALSGLGTDHWFVQNNVLKNKFLLISA